jgi:hypothetical protein
MKNKFNHVNSEECDLIMRTLLRTFVYNDYEMFGSTTGNYCMGFEVFSHWYLWIVNISDCTVTRLRTE